MVGIASRTGARRLVSDPRAAIAAVLFAAATAFAAWSGFSWLGAANAGPPAYSQLRDRVLQEGEQAVLNFNTLDYRRVSQGVSMWEQSSTGALHSQVASGSTQFEQQIRQAQTSTTARILDGALTALNARAGTAGIIIAVQITVTPRHGAPAVKQSRLLGTLTRTPAGWKLSALSPAPVGAAGKSPAG